MSKEYSHRARKRFGQNFLTDQSVLERIVRAFAPASKDRLIEIGPGQGALTKLLLESVDELHAIEIDRDLAAYLRELFSENSNFNLHENDVLKIDFNDLLSSSKPARIIGNLPYNISTPLIFHLLNYLAGIQDMLFMLQLEVVERMAAEPSTKNYGRLSIMAQYYCKVEKLFKVPSSAFSPPPKVESAIVKLAPYPEPPFAVKDPKHLEGLVKQAFSQRRKTLRNNLKTLLSDSDLELLGINPGLRPENISLEDYARICRFLEDNKATSANQ